MVLTPTLRISMRSLPQTRQLQAFSNAAGADDATPSTPSSASGFHTPTKNPANHPFADTNGIPQAPKRGTRTYRLHALQMSEEGDVPLQRRVLDCERQSGGTSRSKTAINAWLVSTQAAGSPGIRKRRGSLSFCQADTDTLKFTGSGETDSAYQGSLDVPKRRLFESGATSHKPYVGTAPGTILADDVFGPQITVGTGKRRSRKAAPPDSCDHALTTSTSLLTVESWDHLQAHLAAVNNRTRTTSASSHCSASTESNDSPQEEEPFDFFRPETPRMGCSDTPLTSAHTSPASIKMLSTGSR